MMNIAVEFQSIVDLAIRSNYSQAQIFDEDKGLRLATTAVNRGEWFAKHMANVGHTYEFVTENQIIARSAPAELPLTDSNEEPTEPREPEEPEEPEEDCLVSRRHFDHEDIEDLLVKDVMLTDSVHRTGIFAWLKEEYTGARGFELGTFDSTLLAVIMKRQAAKWEDLTLGYVSDVITVVHTFICRVMEKIALNERVRIGIMDGLLDRMRDKYLKAMEHARFLLKVELQGTPATLNHYFNDTLEKW